MDKLKAMTTFVAIVDHGSMSAAAEQLSRSPAAVVRSLAELEKQLGVRLLNRSTRRLALTDEGRDYLQHCRQILADIDAAEFQLDSRRANPAGKLAITAPIMFGRLHIAPVLTQWLQQHPSMSAELTLLDRTVDLIEEGFDLALRIGRLADSSLVAKPVGAVKWILCASPKLLESLQLKYGAIKQPDQLSQLPTLGFAATGNQWQFNEHGRDLSVPVNPLFTCNHQLGFDGLLSFKKFGETG